jgi:hypothetical protein
MSKQAKTKHLESSVEHNLYTCEIRDIGEFMALPMFWTMRLLQGATRIMSNNQNVSDIRIELANHLEKPGCLTSHDSYKSFYEYGDVHPCYTNFKTMFEKYRKKDYTDFEDQARKIIAKDEAYKEYINPLMTSLDTLREQMKYQAGFNPKLFGLDCTDNRNYLNEKNKPKCELCATRTEEFGKFCTNHPEMRQIYQQIITEITRMSEENKHSQLPEYNELIRAINSVKQWYVKPGQIGSRRWVY